VDTITHVLTGGVMAKAIGDEKIANWGILAGFAMGFFPDSDFILGLFKLCTMLNLMILGGFDQKDLKIAEDNKVICSVYGLFDFRNLPGQFHFFYSPVPFLFL
jgi:hypothetical protein